MHTPLASDDIYDAVSARPCGTAVLLLAGSSGRLESARADLLSRRGARVRTIRWFGGIGQRPAPQEVPIELFIEQIELLRRDHDRVAIFGTSFGAEAALVTATTVEVDATIAVSPSSVVWSGLAEGRWSSHWTLGGSPLPAVEFDPAWAPMTDPPEYLSLYSTSLTLDPALTAAATIPVERISGDLLLIAGGDDRVWPSAAFTTAISQRRRAHGRSTTIVQHPDAGHRLLLPGEAPAAGGMHMARGGTPRADAALGAQAWPEIARILDLDPG
ncbi:acyl-CoA thioester hydrolase/BAAT C-terminal domain-containing protein [Microbacterium sp. APC 3901]|uniref:acyl-CoA thioester hydrolase/BAAT C-terminal domain-containing protein n=1 Tax=Microbacterium sp. APC 3901 TaxID=3035192 RepID=UPI0025B50071|nr:acyl-CoA thioester hydrolase/BAAT C-terminal domain-containing protein [Microbacterium sp. APC 3901]MDN3443286.1 acyl-CoA thioester hydrolase/BAAT C-terminal domain-containing protein [Microbacterium sp. APC 3901]